jgi:hypothetical protein
LTDTSVGDLVDVIGGYSFHLINYLIKCVINYTAGLPLGQALKCFFRSETRSDQFDTLA